MVVEVINKTPGLAVERESARPLDHACGLCSLRGAKLATRCMAADGDPGGLLVVADHPGRDEDACGRPFVGQTGKYLRGLLKERWPGPVVYDHGVRCAPGKQDVSPVMVGACRGYLAGVLRDARPTRILATGSVAVQALTGRSLPMLSVRRGYSHTSSGVPLFYLLSPGAGLRNRHLRQMFEEDLTWALTATLLPVSPLLEARFVTTPGDAEEAVADLRRARWLALDAEWSGVPYRVCRVRCVSLAPVGADYAYVWTFVALDHQPQRDLLKDLLEDPRIRKVGQNIKSDQHALRSSFGIEVRGIGADCRMMRKVLDPDADADLETMAELVGMGGHKLEMQQALAAGEKAIRALAASNAGRPLTRRGHALAKEARHHLVLSEVADDVRESDDPKSFAFGCVDRKLLCRYNAADAIATARLVHLFEGQLEQDDGAALVWTDLVRPAIGSIERMERWGIAVDRDALDAFHAELGLQISDVEKRLVAYGYEFDPASNRQVADLLYGKLKLKCAELTPSGAPCVDEPALKALKGTHPLVNDLLDWRKLAKLRGTYAAGDDGKSGMLAHIRADGRIHPNINIDGARSGRTSCTSPNLQNIPRASSALGKLARGIFVASPGHVLVQVDYSQLELRIAAALSGDPAMIADFLSGEDFHLRTAKAVSKVFWGIPPEQVTKEHRTQAKSINFGLAYGKTARTFSEELKIPVADAQKLCDAILGRYKRFAAWRDERLHYARMHGHCLTEWRGQEARKRGLWRVADQDSLARSRAEHGSYNSPIQGTASDYCVASIVECVRWIDRAGLDPYVKLVLSVHDSLMLDVRADLVPLVVSEVGRIMRSWPIPNGVPLIADFEVGPSWGALSKYEESAPQKTATATQD